MAVAGVLWRSITTVDMSRLRRWSAVRRGTLLLLTLIVGAVVANPEIGALASVSSLFVGLQERNAAASYTSRVMAVQSVFYGVVVLIAGGLSALPAVSVVIFTAVAGLAGLTAYRDKAMSRMFGDAIPVAAFLGITASGTSEAPSMALAVLIGGLVQALGAVISIRVESDLMERRSVAPALAAVADHLDDALPRQRTTTGQAAEERLSAAAETLAFTDLRGSRLRHLKRLLTIAELLRQEAAAIRLRRALDLPIGDQDQVADALTRASKALRSTAIQLTAVLPGVTRRLGSGRIEPNKKPDCAPVRAAPGHDETARALDRLTRRLPRHLRQLVASTPIRRRGRGRRVAEGLLEPILQPSRRERAVGLRLAVATLISLGVASLFDLPHGAWVAATAVSLLRPDWRPLTGDALGRVLATVLASALAIPLIAASHGSSWVDLLLVFVMAIATFVIAAANEGLYVLATSTVTVFTRALVGDEPVAVAISRVGDVAIGALIAVVFLLAIPIGHGRRLGRDLADYAAATATWLDSIAAMIGGHDPPHEKKLRGAMRAARVRVQHGIELRVAEPMGPGVSAKRASAVFDQLHTAARAAAAAERALKHGGIAGPEATSLTYDAADTLRELAERLPTATPAHPASWPEADHRRLSSDVETLLQHCASAAHAALAAATLPTTRE